MKQFAEEKFSATSLSATNVKGTNTKSKAAKNYNELFSNTPIRFGNMEINNFNHIGPEAVVENLMIHSVSPSARKRVQELYTCNPYEINIKLDEESKNRVAEIVNTYLKAIGLRLVFAKIPKYKYKEVISPFVFDHDPYIQPFTFVPKCVEDKEQYIKDMIKLEEEKRNNPNTIHPFVFDGIDIKRRAKLNENNKIAIATRNMNPREKYEYFKKRSEGAELICSFFLTF